jgi:hypothetical protein
MQKPLYTLIIGLVLLASQIQAQFTDNFEDGSLELKNPSRNPRALPFTIWSTKSPGTYDLKETEGVLKVDYKKLKGTGAFDHFTLRPPNPSNVSYNPHFQLKIKSDKDIKLTIRPVYSFQPPTYEELHHEVKGNNEWQTHTFKLYDYLYTKHSVQWVEIYFDQDEDLAKEAKVEIDDVRLGWRVAKVENLMAQNTKGNAIELSWDTNAPAYTKGYKVFRSEEIRFEPNENYYLGASQSAKYIDKNLEPYKAYFYKIVPQGLDGEDYLPSVDIRAETFDAAAKPTISISKTNSKSVGKYEKFELDLALKNVGIQNPYDPGDIDVYANFTAPDGMKTRINGFYFQNENNDNWKLRFAGNQTGVWQYEVFVNDGGRVSASQKGSFTITDSEHKGWIRPSTKNKRYFAYDNGSSYYPLGVYSPWRNTAERFKTLKEHNANLFAIWDIPYGGFVNETGIIEPELGKYNQTKLGRIDSLLSIMEAQNTQVMYAIWPHDVFSANVWSTQWQNNPYSKFTNAVDVYADELAWEYSKRKYRYMIARFAHSRSWGIWELVNEMNGTDGWQEGRHEDAYNWVEKTSNYFKENDPYHHPTTASFSGGFKEYRKPLYERNDIPNLHMYPAQGWQVKYPGDTLRSALYNYAWAAQRFWNDFEKPAIFGESGADLAYYNRRTPEYHETYHNVIWATLANGLAGIPVWWEFYHLSQEDWDHMSYISEFIKDIDFANENFKPTEISGENVDAYAMASDKGAFGWARTYTSNNISGSKINLKIASGNYQIEWFDGWEGEYVKTSTISVKNGMVTLEVPDLLVARKDLGFRVVTE